MTLHPLAVAVALAARAATYPDDARLIRILAASVTLCRGAPAVRKGDTPLAGMGHADALARVALAAGRLGLVPGTPDHPHGFVRLPSSVTAAGRPARGAYFYARPYVVSTATANAHSASSSAADMCATSSAASAR